MTDAIAKIPQSVADNYALLTQKRAEVATDAAILAKVTHTEGMILVAGSQVAIASMSLDQFKIGMVKTLKKIARDVGVTYWDDAVKMQERFESIMQFAARFYRDMSAQDIETAFDLALAGKMDHLLPKDKEGKPDIKHYNEFGKDYFAKIMKAYKQLKLETWSKANKLIPEPINELSEEERNLYRSSWLNTIREKFKLYKERDERPRFLVPFLVLKEFQKAGIFDGVVQVTDEDISNGFIRMTQDKLISRYQKQRDATEYTEGRVPQSVESKAIQVRYENIIIEVFDKLIEDKLDIDEILPDS